MSAAIKKYLIIFFVLCAFGSTALLSRFISEEWMLSAAQTESENRFLSYVGDTRRVLARYRYLPFLIAENSKNKLLLQGDKTGISEVELHLEQLDKSAETNGWYILDPEGVLIASSRDHSSWIKNDGKLIAQRLAEQQDEVVTLSYITEGNGHYYLAADIYEGNLWLGIAVVKVNLSALTESWLADNEFVLFSNKQQKFFLSTNQQIKSLKFEPDRWKERVLFDRTRLHIWEVEGQRYLVQQVLLDDLKWNIYYLASISDINKSINIVTLLVLTLLVLLLFLLLFIYERRQKLLSKKQFQQLLLESEHRLQLIFNKTNVGLMLLDTDGTIKYLNHTAKRYFYLPDLLLESVSVNQLFVAQESSHTIQVLLKNICNGGPLSELSAIESMAKRSDGTQFPVLLSLINLPFHQQQVYLLTVIDISKRKKAENALRSVNQQLEVRVEQRTAALRNAQEELVQSSKMAALGRMSSAITHEMNQPLTGLRTLLSSNELLIERGEMQILNANMKLVNTLVDRMSAMTTQLKMFAFNRPEKLQAVSVSDTLQQVLRIHQQRLAQCNVRVRMPAQLNSILGESHRLNQVLGNLLVNALDAMQGNDNQTLNISAAQEQNNIIIEVTDNGPGVSEEQLEHLFEPFYTSKKIGEGLGLGLAITANSVRDMQGTITAVNNAKILGENGNVSGMTFRLTFLIASSD